MKIRSLELSDFMLFSGLDTKWSKNINVICGSNSVGKTILLKTMYSLLKSYCETDISSETKDQIETRYVNKLVHVFRPEDMSIGRLVKRKQGSSRAECKMILSNDGVISVGFGNRQTNHMELVSSQIEKKEEQPDSVVYFPPKEIISSTENFRSLYESYHIAFEETYYDLAKLLDHPLTKGPKTAEQNTVLESLGNIMNGKVVSKNGKFYLNVSGQGEFEMGLVSEGYRKLATIVYLILNGSLNSNSVLFWDEPESNMNPKMIRPLTEAIIQLAKLGVQVFITTHDYFLMQYLNMYMAYPESNPDQIDIRFLSLFKKEDGQVCCETASEIGDLTNNSIMEEFDAIYDREQGFIYDSIRKPD